MRGLGLLVGVAVGRYEHPEWPPLETRRDVEEWQSAVAEDSWQGLEPLMDPDEAQVRLWLRQLRGRLPDGGALVAVWNGHGQPDDLAPERLRLIAADTPYAPSDGLLVDEFVASVAKSGANQILVVLDMCSLAARQFSAAQAAQSAFQAFPPSDGQLWFGVVAASTDGADAYEGRLGQELRRLLRDGPDRPELRMRWSRQNRFLRGDDLCDALQHEWNNQAQEPAVLTRGSARWVFPNPLFEEGAAPEVVEHLSIAARGGASLQEQSAFTGRVEEVNQVVGWVRRGQPGIYVVTGSPGTGKSAVVGRVVSLSVPSERQRLEDQGGWEHDDPGEGSVAAHVHARGLTVDRMAQLLDGWLHSQRPAVLASREGEPRNAAQLIGDLQNAVELGAQPPVVVVDGLDEADIQAFGIVDRLLVRLSRFATVIVSTHDLPSPDQRRPGLLEALAPQGAHLDLDDPDVAARGCEHVVDYVVRRLEGRSERMDARAVAGQLSARGARTVASQPFLLARLVTDQLRQRPVDTNSAGWEQLVGTSLAEVFEADLARVQRPLHCSEKTDGPFRARLLLEALCWGFGRGLPEDEWLTIANALADEAFVRDDVWWLLEQLGRYVIEDGEDGRAVYRIAHASLAEHVRPTFVPSRTQLFEPAASPVMKALAGRLEQLLKRGSDVGEIGYLWQYLWRHAAAAGEAGLMVLRDLANRYPSVRPGLALAVLEVSGHLRLREQRVEAVDPSEEAVALYRALAANNAEFVPDLARSLGDLAARYGEVGRPFEAVGLREEAIELYRALAADNAAYVPDLSVMLGNLAVCYFKVGREPEAIGPTEEAVELQRALAADNDAYVPTLSRGLYNLGVFYRLMGRREEAVAATEEAVARFRALPSNSETFVPDLAMALNDLGGLYNEVGRQAEAVAPTEEAVALYGELAADDEVFAPDLASASNNLGMLYSQMGRRAEAVAPTEEAVTLRQVFASHNEASVPDLAMSLHNLGILYGEAGRELEAGLPTEKAVAMYRALAADDPAFVPNLAMSVKNLGVLYAQMGRPAEAVPLTEEAVAVYRRLAADDPAFVPELASALNDLGIRYSRMGRRTEAVAPSEEAVALYRALAAHNEAFAPDLAMSLNNLGILRSQMGRRSEAVATSEEAVARYRALATENTAFVPNLALSLNSLGDRYCEGDGQDPDRIDIIWGEVLEQLSHARSLLLMWRCSAAVPGTSGAVSWLIEGLRSADDDTDLVTALREQALRHRLADPARFDAAWEELTGQAPPGWMTLES